MINIFKISAVIGLLFMIISLFLTKEKQKKLQYIFFILGGLFLVIYSIYLEDWIFIILQIAFILASIYGLVKFMKKKK